MRLIVGTCGWQYADWRGVLYPPGLRQSDCWASTRGISPPPRHGRGALDAWLARLGELWPGEEQVQVYFNNDPGGSAVRNAHQLVRLAARRGLQVARPPSG